MVVQKIAVDVERLVSWAFRDELPKLLIASSSKQWRAVEAVCNMWAVVDPGSHSFQAEAGIPHPDARVIGTAVERLASQIVLDWQEFRTYLLGECYRIAPLADVLAGRVFSAVSLVSVHAQMGTRPRWDLGRPRPRPVIAANGRPALNGAKKDVNRYTIGSSCPLNWCSPSVGDLAFARAEYVVWHGGLRQLAEMLAGQLTAFEPIGPAAAAAPWLTGREPVSRVLPSLLAPRPVNENRVANHRRRVVRA